jgi:HEAT repeat protein
MLELLTLAAVAFGLSGALSVFALTARRLVVVGRERRRVAAEARLRPLALALLEGEAGSLHDLARRDVRVLAGLIGRYRRRIRGESAERITAFFEQRGLVDRELRALRSLRAWRRATAAFALGDMGAETATSALVRALQDPKRCVRASAARSLGSLEAVAAVDPIVHAFAERRVPRLIAGQALLSIGPAAAPVLCRLTSDPDPEARAFAIELLGLLGDPVDASYVLPHLRDTSAEVRAKAARALGRLGAEEAAAELAAALEDRIVFVRAVAARALGLVGDTSAVPVLLEVARRDDFAAAHAAAAAAARLDPRQVTVAAAQEAAGPHLQEAATLLAVRR